MPGCLNRRGGPRIRGDPARGHAGRRSASHTDRQPAPRAPGLVAPPDGGTATGLAHRGDVPRRPGLAGRFGSGAPGGAARGAAAPRAALRLGAARTGPGSAQRRHRAGRLARHVPLVGAPRRSERQPSRRYPCPQGAQAAAQGAAGGPGRRAGHAPTRAGRPGAARAGPGDRGTAVRLRAARGRTGGPGTAARRRRGRLGRPGRGQRARAGQGRQAAQRAGGRAGARGAARLAGRARRAGSGRRDGAVRQPPRHPPDAQPGALAAEGPGAAGRAAHPRAPAHAAPQLRQPPAAVQRRPARRAGTAGSRQHRHDAGLHPARLPAPGQGVRRGASARPAPRHPRADPARGAVPSVR